MMQFRYRDTAGVSEQTMQAHLEELEPYREHLLGVRSHGGYIEPECSINVPFDDQLAQSAYQVADRFRSDGLRYVIVVAIGGANLGTKAVYDALRGALDPYQDRSPKLVFVDTTSPTQLQAVLGLIETLDSPEQVVVSIASKSGGTTETIFNAELLVNALLGRFGKAANQRVVVTTQPGSPLGLLAQQRGYPVLDNPALVGGRYSVLTPIGLFPLALAGIDVEGLRAGARDLVTLSLTDSVDNATRDSAAIVVTQYEAGHSIHDTFLFAPELESVGKWYRQLVGESLGKQTDLDGKEVFTGITPTVSVGSTDLHSVGQLYLGGPKDKLTTFIWSETYAADPQLSEERVFADLVPAIKGKSASEVMSAILEGTKIAYQKQKRPFMELALEQIDAYTIGALLQMKMIEIMYAGHLLNVNPFDQPNVENYKIETKKILEE